jgi:hypothetical protein
MVIYKYYHSLKPNLVSMDDLSTDTGGTIDMMNLAHTGATGFTSGNT